MVIPILANADIKPKMKISAILKYPPLEQCSGLVFSPTDNNLILAYPCYTNADKEPKAFVVNIKSNEIKPMIVDDFIQAVWLGGKVMFLIGANKWLVKDLPFARAASNEFKIDGAKFAGLGAYNPLSPNYVWGKDDLVIPNERLKLEQNRYPFDIISRNDGSKLEPGIYEKGTNKLIYGFNKQHVDIGLISPDGYKFYLEGSMEVIFNRLTNEEFILERNNEWGNEYYWLPDSLHLLVKRIYMKPNDEEIKDEFYIYNYLTKRSYKVALPKEIENSIFQIQDISDNGKILARLGATKGFYVFDLEWK